MARDISQIAQSVVEEYLLGGTRKYNRLEVSEQSRVPLDTAQRLWVALGFPAVGSDSAVDFTDADIAAIKDFHNLNVLAAADNRLQTTAARAIGQTMARLAEWQADMVLGEITQRIHAADPQADPVEVTKSAVTATLTILERLQSYTWRRHLDATLSRLMDGQTHPSPDSTRVLAVGFADMVGYTRLTRHLPPDELATLLEAFESTTTAAVTENGGWVIKNVGDEVMFAAETAVAAARIATAIQETTMTLGTTPELRVALAYGPVLQRFGDLYGSVVNMAARLTGVARPGTILVDDGAAAELARESEFDIRHLRSVRVRGFNRLRPHVLRHRDR